MFVYHDDDVGIHQWILFAAILEVKKKEKNQRTYFVSFLFLPRPEGGFHGSLDSLLSFSVFECTGCQGRCLRYTHISHTHTD